MKFKGSLLHKIIFLVLAMSFLPYLIYNSLSNLFEYKNEFLIPLKNGCYYAEGVVPRVINLSNPYEEVRDYNPIVTTRCWTMNDYKLNETAIDMKIKEIDNAPRKLLFPVIAFPFIWILISLIVDKIKHKNLNTSSNSPINGGEIKGQEEGQKEA